MHEPGFQLDRDDAPFDLREEIDLPRSAPLALPVGEPWFLAARGIVGPELLGRHLLESGEPPWPN